MIPNIRTLEHVDVVLRRLPQWRGKTRVQVLEACSRRLIILRRANKISAAELKDYRGRVLPKLAEAKRRHAVARKSKAQRIFLGHVTSEHSSVYQMWYNAQLAKQFKGAKT